MIQVLNRTLGYAARAGATSEQSSLAQSTSAPCVPKTGVVHVKSVDGNNECGYLSGKPNQYDLKGQFSCTSQKEDALIVHASCDAPKFDLVALVSMLIVAGQQSSDLRLLESEDTLSVRWRCRRCGEY